MADLGRFSRRRGYCDVWPSVGYVPQLVRVYMLRFEPMDQLLRFGQENREMAVESIMLNVMLLLLRTYSTD